MQSSVLESNSECLFESGGEWRLEITLNFPTGSVRYGNYADVWRKEVLIKIPDLPADNKSEVLDLRQPIHLGYVKDERKGPTER